mmetsp:Transcript_20465/g.64367  ORF Transcript_20465/g.64367 Transcript_20465/m.64367 type:complete len:295 (+) Transcript_20465:380-1264(+)
MLIDRGADLNRARQGGSTPLFISCGGGHADVVRFLLERGADVDGDDGSTPLWIACQNDCADAARACLDHGADVNRVDERGCSPLQVASQFGYVDPARLCLERGADINQMTPSAGINSFSPRACANIYGHEAMAAWLARIRTVGSWTRYHSEPRYELVVLRELVLRGRAWRQRTFQTKADVVEMLFPGPARYSFPDMPRLPDELFSIILSYYWGGVLSAEERTAAAAEAAAAEFGSTSSEAKTAWAVVEEINDSLDAPAAALPGLDQDCVVAALAKCREFDAAMASLEDALANVE